MGCISSSMNGAFKFSNVQWERDFKVLGLTRSEVNTLYDVFCGIDLNVTGYLTHKDLLEYIRSEASSFVNRVLNCSDDNEKIDFREFVVMLWTFCIIDYRSMAYFIFDLYDNEKHGIMDKASFRDILRDIYGESFEKSAQAKKVEAELNALSKSNIIPELFQDFCMKNQGMLYPVFLLQTQFIDKVCGKTFWQNISESKSTKYGSQYIPCSVILQHQGNRGEIHKHLNDLDIKRKKRNALLNGKSSGSIAEETPISRSGKKHGSGTIRRGYSFEKEQNKERQDENKRKVSIFQQLYAKSPSDDAIKSPRNKESIKSPRNKESKVLLKSNSRDGHKIHSHG